MMSWDSELVLRLIVYVLYVDVLVLTEQLDLVAFVGAHPESGRSETRR